MTFVLPVPAFFRVLGGCTLIQGYRTPVVFALARWADPDAAAYKFADEPDTAEAADGRMATTFSLTSWTSSPAARVLGSEDGGNAPRSVSLCSCTATPAATRRGERSMVELSSQLSADPHVAEALSMVRQLAQSREPSQG
jgi:hypothetical protein